MYQLYKKFDNNCGAKLNSTIKIKIKPKWYYLYYLLNLNDIIFNFYTII